MLAPGTRFLIVEDETIIAMTAEDLVEDLGGTVAAVATTLESGLQAVMQGGFDAALLDLNLHGENSTPIAQALRAAGLPFLFTTGYGASGRPDGFDEVPVVSKPYGCEALRSALAELLG